LGKQIEHVVLLVPPQQEITNLLLFFWALRILEIRDYVVIKCFIVKLVILDVPGPKVGEREV